MRKIENSDGTVEDFSPYDGFEIGMIEGCEAGEILVDDSLDVYFEEAYQPIYFVADSNITGTDTVKIRAGLIEGIIGSSNPIVSGGGQTESKAIDSKSKNTRRKLNKKIKEPEPLPMNPTAYCFIGDITRDLLGDGSLVVGDESIEIMLGETKYFQAKFNELEQKLEIVEVEDQLTGVSQNEGSVEGEEGWEWVTEDIWGTDPVTPVIEDGLSAVYWEKRYPVYIDEHGEHYRDYDKSKELDDGLIRVVGRFWEEKKEGESEKDYTNRQTIVLKATKNEIESQINIFVDKPNYLGRRYNEISEDIVKYPIPKDVKGNEYNLDEIIVEYAGKYGIPPQFIKADVQKESIGFNPSYRYEPFYDSWHLQRNRNKAGTSKYLKDNFQYKIKLENSTPNEGNPAIPTDHSNVKPTTYPGYVGTIWDYLFDHCKDINPSVSDADNYYPRKEKIWYDTPREKWIELYNKHYEIFIKKNKKEVAKSLAIDSANTWVKDKWQDGVMGKDESIAQTRSAASFGLLQILYTTANGERKYPIDDDHLPEYLNITKTCFSYAIPYLKGKLAFNLNISIKDDDWEETLNNKNNWSLGLEETYKRAFNLYNGADEDDENEINGRLYGKKVMDYNKKYDPLNEE
jgi:hypothetical protein